MTQPTTQLTDHQRFLVQLVSTPSVSGDERRAAELFARRAAELGLDAHVDDVDNAVAHRGPEDAPVHVVLLGHIDTVPGDIPVRLERGVLFGRGSVDAKCPLAAMLAAAAEADLSEGVRLTVAGAAGEETTGSPGARHLIHKWSPDACIIGEPSSWRGVTLGYKGRLLATASASVEGHHSAADEASAADLVLAWWQRVLDYADARNAGRDRVFDRLQTTIQDLTHANDGLTQSASLLAGLRLGPEHDPHELSRELMGLADGSVTVECTGHERAHASERNDPVVRALTSAVRAAGDRPVPKLKTGTADLNVVAPVWRCPIAAYGPGDSALDHTPNEHIHLDEFDRAVGVLKTALRTLTTELLETTQTASAPAG